MSEPRTEATGSDESADHAPFHGDDLISVITVAAEFGKRKATIFKILKRLNIETKKRRLTSSGNQLVAFITRDDFMRVRSELATHYAQVSSEILGDSSESQFVFDEQGVFYLLQLESNHDPGRFKVGFANNLDDRLRSLRCSAPFARVIKSWPCRRLWEKTAIDCVTADCERLHTEVFRTDSLERIISQCEQFFSIMPKVDQQQRMGKWDRQIADDVETGRLDWLMTEAREDNEQGRCTDR